MRTPRAPTPSLTEHVCGKMSNQTGKRLLLDSIKSHEILSAGKLVRWIGTKYDEVRFD
jgi:hypothetical protein